MFYRFDQNNSGGSFIQNDEVASYVFIEANSADEANARAESIGIYFNGCDDDRDCPCCGDRWSSAWSDDGMDEPMIYGTAVKEYHDIWSKGVAYAHVYYADGTKVSYK